jgi:hypothetical protein
MIQECERILAIGKNGCAPALSGKRFCRHHALGRKTVGAKTLYKTILPPWSPATTEQFGGCAHHHIEGYPGIGRRLHQRLSRADSHHITATRIENASLTIIWIG